jgi:hypothetical protein
MALQSQPNKKFRCRRSICAVIVTKWALLLQSGHRPDIAHYLEYGASVYNFVTDHRLNQVHASIIASTTPLKTLAARLGYSHVNHFIVAFKRKFGYPPGSLRKAGAREVT